MGHGMIADRYGRRKTLLAGLWIVNVLTLLTAIFATSFTSFCTLRFLTGLGLGVLLPLGTTFINELAPPGQTVAAAKAWLKTNPSAVAPWDAKGYRVKDAPYTPAGAVVAMAGNAMVSRQTNLNFPAQRNILSCIYEGVQVPMDAGLRIEAR